MMQPMPPDPYAASTERYDHPSKTSGLAIAALVLGIFGLLTGVFIIGLLVAVVGLILGIIALTQIGKPGQAGKGRGLAITGIVLSSLTLVLIPIALLLIGIFMPAMGAARTTARQMASNTQARGIQQAMVIHAQSAAPNADGDRPMTSDVGELLLGNYFTVDYTQSPMDQVDGNEPADFNSMSPDDQADWVRVHSDYVLVPGLVDDLDHAKIALFGKPDRFDGGIPVTRNDNSTSWEVDVPRIEQELQAQTGKTMAELIAEAEAMAGTP